MSSKAIKELSTEELQNLAKKGDGKAALVLLKRAEERRFLAPFDENLPFSKDRLCSEIRFFQAADLASRIEIGKRLIVLKENLEHGDFEDTYQELGFTRDSAAKHVKVAVRFSNVFTSRHLNDGSKINFSKAYLLAAELQEDETDALFDGDKIREMFLDDIEQMSVRELKEKLRDGRKDQRRHERALEKKDIEISGLANEIKRLKSALKSDRDEESQQILMEKSLEYDGIFALLSRVDPEDLSPHLRAKVLTMYEYMATRAGAELAEARETYSGLLGDDPTPKMTLEQWQAQLDKMRADSANKSA